MHLRCYGRIGNYELCIRQGITQDHKLCLASLIKFIFSGVKSKAYPKAKQKHMLSRMESCWPMCKWWGLGVYAYFVCKSKSELLSFKPIHLTHQLPCFIQRYLTTFSESSFVHFTKHSFTSTYNLCMANSPHRQKSSLSHDFLVIGTHSVLLYITRIIESQITHFICPNASFYFHTALLCPLNKFGKIFKIVKWTTPSSGWR